MKVLFIFTAVSANDRRAWSGTMHQAYRGLVRAGHEVDYLCAMRDYQQALLDKLICTYWLRVPAFFGKKTRMDEAFYTVRVLKQTLRTFDYSPYDLIFVPTHIAILNALPVRTAAKVVHLADATVDSLFEYYSEFSNLIFHNYWEAHILGKRAFRRADLNIVSSDWCRQNAMRDYGIAPDKLAVVEFGANIEPEDVPAAPKQLDGKKHLNIYWSGVNWERKGGDVALACCDELVARGHDISFHITGMRRLPDGVTGRSYVHNHGFLDKNKPDEYRELVGILRQQDIFLFPSRAECSSIALCEACGFGLPCFAYNTGGTGNYIVEGANGYMLPLSAGGRDFADRMEQCITAGSLNRLSEGAARRYQEKLNWTTWSERVNTLIGQ